MGPGLWVWAIAVVSTVRSVRACLEPAVAASSVYDAVSGGVVYFAGQTCANNAVTVSSPSNYICSQPCNGLSIEYIDSTTGATYNSSFLPPPVTFQCCAMDSSTSIMYCVGGVTVVSTSLEYVYRYSVPQQSWLQPVPSPTSIVSGRTGHSCTFSAGSFFVFGGLAADKTVATPQFFSFAASSNTFTSDYPNSPASRLGHVLTAVPSGDLLLLYGTYSLATPTEQLPGYIFRIATSTWSEYIAVSSNVTPEVLYGASCTPWSSTMNPNGGVFCFGGETTSLISNPHLTFLNLSSNEWIDLGIPPAYSSSFSPVSTFGATVAILDGGNAAVVRAGGEARFDSATTYTTPQNSIICSPTDSNNNSGSFYGILPFGPNTTVDSCYLTSTCPKNTTGLNVPVIVPGWTNPPSDGFPIVNASTFANSGGSAAGTSNNDGNSSSAVPGWKTALGILIPIYLLLCLLFCCSWHRKRKSELAAYGRLHNHAFSGIFGHFELWEMILFALAVLFPLLFILLLCLLWRSRQRRQTTAGNYRRHADQSNIPLISKYFEPPSSMQLFETSTGLVPGTYPAAPARKPPSESSRKQEQQPNLQGSSGADMRSYVLDTSVESVTGAVIAGAAATYATSAGNTSDSDDTSFDLSTRRTPDGYVSEPNIKLSNGFIATYDSVISNAAKSPAKPDVYYSIRTGALKQQSTNFSSQSSGNGLVNSAASEYVAIERKDGLNVGLAAGAAVTAVGAGLSVLMRTQSDLQNPAPAKMRNFRAQFAKKKYSVEPSEVAAELGPQFFEGARVTANNAVATSVYLPTVTETVTTTTTTNEQGTETKTVVHLKPSYVAKTGSLSAIEASTQAIAVQKANFALDRARRFLYACQTSYGGKFDIRTFEIMSLFARPQFEVSVMFEFLLEFALTGEELTAGVISDSFYVSAAYDDLWFV
ncbi:hypothetical protein HDU83_006474 [Entophlyctis luteolus]|nr:hypothetical protein HDU83_006474 [Entophlyctis luteolus]